MNLTTRRKHRQKRVTVGLGFVTTSLELTNYWLRKLSERKWTWFVTLTFQRPDIPLWIAKRAFETWIFDVEVYAGLDGAFRWFLVADYGMKGDDLRLHLVIGKLRSASKFRWMSHWQELVDGDADISYAICYGSVRKFIEQIVARPGRLFETRTFDW